MRVLVVLVCLVCTTAAADDGWRYQSREKRTHLSNDKIEVAPDPPLAAFTRPGTFYMLAVDDAAKAHCDAWTLDPTAKTFAGPGGTTLALHSEGTHLQLGARCAEWMNVSEIAGDVDVDGSTWFRDRGACMQAIATHRPVATDLGRCIAEPAPRPGAQVRATLDRVLTRGGTLFAIVQEGAPRDDPSDDSGNRTSRPRAAPRCEPVRADGVSFHHALVENDWNGHTMRGETEWQYSYNAGDDDFTVTDGSTSWSDGSGFGLLCAHTQHIQLGKDWADLGERYYFSVATCRAAIARERELTSWFAKPSPDHTGGPGFAGC